MIFKSNPLIIFLFLYFLSSLEFNTSLSDQSRRSLHVSSSSDFPQTPAWIDPNRTYFSQYISPAKRRSKGSCWQIPTNASKIAIVAMFKNEALGIREWLDHYMWQGIDSILLLDNGSTDIWEPIVQEYSRVTVHDAPLRHNQVKYYDKSLSWLRENNIDIAIFADIDEFIFSLDERSLQEVLLEFFFDPAMADVSELFIPWSQFGSSGLEHQPESVRFGFTWRKSNGPGIRNSNGKTFFRVKEILKAEIHVPPMKTGRLVYAGDRYERELLTDMFDSRAVDIFTSGPPLQLNHFAIQSMDFYRNVKMTRGAADMLDFEEIRTWKYFQFYDYHDVEDTFLRDYVTIARMNGTLHGFHCIQQKIPQK